MATVPGFERSTVDRMTKFAWRMRFTLAERSAITEAAKTDSDVLAIKEDFESITDEQGISPSSPLATGMLQVFVDKGLIEPDRAAIIGNPVVKPEEAV